MQTEETKIKVTVDMEEVTRRLTLLVASIKAAEDRVSSLEARRDALLQDIGRLETDKLQVRGATRKG